MSILWADIPSGSQGLYGSDHSLMLDGLYAEVAMTLGDDPDGTIGANGRVLRSWGGTNTYLRRVLGGAFTTVGMGFRQWLFGLPTTSARAPNYQLVNGSNTVVATLQVNTDGTLRLYKGSHFYGTLLAQTAAPVIVANAWQHIEWWHTVDPVNGRSEVRIDGASAVIDFSGNTDLDGMTLNQFRIYSTGDPTGFALKDIFAANGEGTENNDFVGPCGVYWLPPEADISSGWSRTTGATDYEILDTTPPNDANYIYAGQGPIPAPAIVGCASLPDDIVGVRAVLPIMRARKSDGGDATVQMSLLSGADSDPGGVRAISTAFTYWFDVSETDPSTLAPWTPAAVNAVQLQFNRTT